MRELIYENGWSDWEEGAGVRIYLDKCDRLFHQDYGDGPESGSWDFETEIGWENALAIVEEWEENYPTVGKS